MKPSTQPHTPHFEPAEADIQKCAYFLWQEEGCPEGRDLDIWLAAKELVRHRVHTAPPVRKAGRSSPHRRLTS